MNKLKKLVYFIFLFSSHSAHGQNVSVEMYKFDYLYKGVFNPFKVVIENLSCESIHIEANRGKLSGSGCSYNIVVDSFQPVLLRISSIIESDTNHIANFLYKVKSVPKPSAGLSSNKGGAISLEEFKTQRGLILHNDHWYLVGCGSIPITKFKLMVVRDDKMIGVSHNIGAIFEKHTRKLIDKIRKNDIVYS